MPTKFYQLFHRLDHDIRLSTTSLAEFMSLFDVPGWRVPSEGPATHSNPRKRKRPSTTAGDEKPISRMHSAEVNMDKLMKKLAHAEAHTSSEQPREKDQRRKGRAEFAKDDTLGILDTSSLRKHATVTKEDGRSSGAVATATHKKKGKEKKERKKRARSSLGTENHEMIEKTEPSVSGLGAPVQNSKSLTGLQSKMKGKLEGARFRYLTQLQGYVLSLNFTLFEFDRWINETLYKSESKDAEKLMREDPQVFEEV